MNVFWLAMTTAVIWGTVPLIEKIGLTKVEPVPGLFYRSFGVVLGIVLMATIMLKPQQIKEVDPKSALLLILSGFLASFVAQITFYKCLKIGEVSKVVPLAATFPLVTFILGVFLMGESFTLSKLLGVGLVFSGILLLK